MPKPKFQPWCKKCKNDEVRKLVFGILDNLPMNLVVDYACEKLGLQTHDEWVDSMVGADEMRREQ